MRSLLSLFLCWSWHASAQSSQEVVLESGKIRGVQMSDGLYAYRGIPYAQAPVGDLRWRPPIPPRMWKDVRDATKFGAECLQSGVTARTPGTNFSEDCLFLNVVRPMISENGSLPVLVWFHGNQQGQGNSSAIPAEHLARQGIIVVTFNYRMGRFGFFAHPVLARENQTLRGNYGYMDQVAVLEWVQQNIDEFGGDPSKVTIAGSSFGGGSVLVMLTSPLAQGLFQRAILQSPVWPSARNGTLGLREIAQAEAHAVNLIRGLGIEGSIQDVLTAIRKLPAATLNNGLEEPMIDGLLVVDSQDTLVTSGQFAKVPLLIGTNDSDLAESTIKSKTVLFAQFAKLAPKARTLYDPKGENSFNELLSSVIADRNVHEPARFLGEVMGTAAQPVYLYRFSYVNSAKRESTPGATHGAEIPYVLDAIGAQLGKVATESDIEMGRKMSAYWVAFIKRGDPNGEDRTAWPRYNSDSRELMNFSNTGIVYRPDPLKERLDLWQEVWESLSTPSK